MMYDNLYTKVCDIENVLFNRIDGAFILSEILSNIFLTSIVIF